MKLKATKPNITFEQLRQVTTQLERMLNSAEHSGKKKDYVELVSCASRFVSDCGIAIDQYQRLYPYQLDANRHTIQTLVHWCDVWSNIADHILGNELSSSMNSKNFRRLRSGFQYYHYSRRPLNTDDDLPVINSTYLKNRKRLSESSASGQVSSNREYTDDDLPTLLL